MVEGLDVVIWVVEGSTMVCWGLTVAVNLGLVWDLVKGLRGLLCIGDTGVVAVGLDCDPLLLF